MSNEEEGAASVEAQGGVNLKATVTAEPNAPNEGTDKGKAEETPPVVTRHEVQVGGRTLRYRVTTGMLPIRNEKDEKEEAKVFFIAYTLDREEVLPVFR